MDPLVSAIIPVHNGEQFLSEAIRSVLAQDYHPVEVIVVDDASTDSSSDLADGFDGVTLLSSPSQVGAAEARNIGLREAKGEFLAFLDADDVWQPNKLSLQMAFLSDHPAVACVLGKQSIVLEPGLVFPQWLLRPEGGVVETPPLSALVRRGVVEAVGEFDPKYRIAHDIDWLFRMRAGGFAVETIPQVVVRRRIHVSNLSHSVSEMSREFMNSLRENVQLIRKSKGEK